MFILKENLECYHTKACNHCNSKYVYNDSEVFKQREILTESLFVEEKFMTIKYVICPVCGRKNYISAYVFGNRNYILEGKDDV